MRRPTPTRFSIAARLIAIATLSFAALFTIAADKPHRVEVDISGLKFKPEKIKIHVGDTVTWINNDDRDHTVACNEGHFKSGNIKAGQTFEFKFTQAGTYSYGCSYHPRMRGAVVVE